MGLAQVGSCTSAKRNLWPESVNQCSGPTGCQPRSSKSATAAAPRPRPHSQRQRGFSRRTYHRAHCHRKARDGSALAVATQSSSASAATEANGVIVVALEQVREVGASARRRSPCCADCKHLTSTIKKDGAHFTSFARIANLYLKAVEAALEQLQQKNPQVTEKQVHVEPVPHSVVTRVALADFEDLPGDWRNHLQDQHSHPAAE